MPFNGPGRELRPDHGTDFSGEKVYCTQCGTIFVPAHYRDCPACTLAEMIDAVDDRLETLADEQTTEDDT